MFRNASAKMTQKISQNKTYVAVNVPSTTNASTSNKLFSVFKRKSSAATKPESEKKSEYARLFSLAKPEKWNIVGKLESVGFCSYVSV